MLLPFDFSLLFFLLTIEWSQSLFFFDQLASLSSYAITNHLTLLLLLEGALGVPLCLHLHRLFINILLALLAFQDLFLPTSFLFVEILPKGLLKLTLLCDLLLLHFLFLLVLVAYDGSPFVENLLLASDR